MQQLFYLTRNNWYNYVVLSVAFIIRVADFHFRLTQYAPKCFLCSMVNIVYRKWEKITEELQSIYIYIYIYILILTYDAIVFQ